MSLARRIIPCLDVAAGRVVKGVNFENLRDMGDPVELAALYFAQGADELTFLDVTATVDDRSTTYDVVRRTAEEVFIPLTVGGGVRSADDVARLLAVGADKVGVNSAAIARPDLVGEIADRFGAQVLVLSLDVKRAPGTRSGFVVTTHGGRTATNLDALDWAREAIDRGAGELLVNSIDADGTKDGFDLELVGPHARAVAGPRHRFRRCRQRRPFRPGRARRSRRRARGIRLPLRAADDRRRQGRAQRRRHRGAPMTVVDDPRIGRVAFNADGLVPAIIQQHDTGEVLMLGWMDAEALRRTLTEGRVTFWSRSRQEYWRKGDTSGHAQYVRGARLDCDGDTLLIAVEQIGAACHTGDHTCFDADDLSPLVSFAPLDSDGDAS